MLTFKTQSTIVVRTPLPVNTCNSSSESFQTSVKNFRKHGISISHLNINSLRSKLDQLKVLISDLNTHIFCLTGTLLDATVTTAELSIPNFNLLRNYRTRHGDGCCVHSSLDYTCPDSLHVDGIESLWCNIKPLFQKSWLSISSS